VTIHPENVFNNLSPQRKFTHLSLGSQQDLREEYEDLRRITQSWKLYLAIRLSGEDYGEEAEANFYMPESRAA
jgi:hypothetical protein